MFSQLNMFPPFPWKYTHVCLLTQITQKILAINSTHSLQRIILQELASFHTFLFVRNSIPLSNNFCCLRKQEGDKQTVILPLCALVWAKMKWLLGNSGCSNPSMSLNNEFLTGHVHTLGPTGDPCGTTYCSTNWYSTFRKGENKEPQRGVLLKGLTFYKWAGPRACTNKDCLCPSAWDGEAGERPTRMVHPAHKSDH